MTADAAPDLNHGGVCPHRSYDWALPAQQANPFPALAEARRETPVFWSEQMQCYVLTRHADVAAAAKNTEAFSSSEALVSGDVPAELRDRLPDGYPYEPPTLVNGEGPHHSRIRKIVLSVLSPRRVSALQPLVQSLVDKMVTALPSSGPFDLCSTIAVPLPLTVITGILGFPEADAAQLKAWSDEFSLLVGNPGLEPAERLHASQAMVDMREYLLAQIASRRAERGSDLMSALLWAGDDDSDGPLTESVLISMFTQLVEAGNETATILIGNLMYLLLSHPEQWRAVCNDESLRGAAIEEALRRMGAVTGMLRRTTRDVVVGGVRLEAGRRVVLMFASANHDPDVFSEPEEFNIYRTGNNRHLAFGLGEHLCVGAPLARLEVRCLLDALCKFGDRLQLGSRTRWALPPTLYGFSELFLELT